MWAPITEAEVITIRLPMSSAPGLDGITVRRWFTEIPAILRAAILNVFMAAGAVPPRFRDSRTVLVPKSADRMEPANYRPISISSVVLRHLHKILAKRPTNHDLIDVRQRAFISADGCAENIAVLSALLRDAHSHMNQIHVVTLDVQKAFDTVSHYGIRKVLFKYGFPKPMVEYLWSLYSTATVRLEVDGRFSEELRPGRGVRQGDPLSPLIFNLIMNEVLAAIPEEIGYKIRGLKVNALAFADDLILVGSTGMGAQASLDRVGDVLRSYELRLSPAKCAALSLVPAGKAKKMKVLTDLQFMVDGAEMPQLDTIQSIRYLGIYFDRKGLVMSNGEIGSFLERIGRAPLKPQQRMKLLNAYLMPRYIHGLVLGRTTHGLLRKMDRTVRAAVRRWLRLPGDTPNAFFHTPIKSGGLRVMSFETAIPEMALNRLESLKLSQSPIVRVVGGGNWAERRLKWCRMARRTNGDWTKLLRGSVDGFELRQAADVQASTQLLRDEMLHIPSGDWLQYLRVWINALPTRVRTTRGERRRGQDVNCRAGCGVTETAAHVIQQCFRTHGGLILRHDNVATIVAGEMDRLGYMTRREHLFQTSSGGRKPDIVAAKQDRGVVLDVQIVSGARPLTDAHKRKRQYYAGNEELVGKIAALLQVPRTNITVSTITLSWRGVWAHESANLMAGLGISKAILNGITTRVIKGSLLNFRRFNQTTMVHRGRSHMRMSGWGPPQF